MWPRARALRFDENVGFCVGCNRGAEAATGRLLAFVNFDGEVEPGWDTPLAGLLDDPTVSISTGLLLSSDGQMIQAAGLGIAPNTAVVGRLVMLPRETAPLESVDVPAATGALMMVRRQEFLASEASTSRSSCTAKRPTIACACPAGSSCTPEARCATIRPCVGPDGRSFVSTGAPEPPVNAARHLPPASLVSRLWHLRLRRAHARAAAARVAAGAIARGWLDGARDAPRASARTSDDAPSGRSPCPCGARSQSSGGWDGSERASVLLVARIAPASPSGAATACTACPARSRSPSAAGVAAAARCRSWRRRSSARSTRRRAITPTPCPPRRRCACWPPGSSVGATGGPCAGRP